MESTVYSGNVVLLLQMTNWSMLEAVDSMSQVGLPFKAYLFI